MLHEILFYSFGVFALTTGFFVVVEKNPIHAVFFLVLCFVNAAGMLLMVGAEFLAFMFLVVYVGAIAVLFLFVVMMLNIAVEEARSEYFSMFFVIGIILVCEFVFLVVAKFPKRFEVCFLLSANSGSLISLFLIKSDTAHFP